MASRSRRSASGCATSNSPKHSTLRFGSEWAVEQSEIEGFWLELLQLPPTCLRKSTINTYSKYSKKKRRNKLPYGTCRLTVSDTRLVQHIYGAIQEYAGFEREEWVM